MKHNDVTVPLHTASITAHDAAMCYNYVTVPTHVLSMTASVTYLYCAITLYHAAIQQIEQTMDKPPMLP
jgi:hypothetical protein